MKKIHEFLEGMKYIFSFWYFPLSDNWKYKEDWIKAREEHRKRKAEEKEIHEKYKELWKEIKK